MYRFCLHNYAYKNREKLICKIKVVFKVPMT